VTTSAPPANTKNEVGSVARSVNSTSEAITATSEPNATDEGSVGKRTNEEWATIQAVRPTTPLFSRPA